MYDDKADLMSSDMYDDKADLMSSDDGRTRRYQREVRASPLNVTLREGNVLAEK